MAAKQQYSVCVWVCIWFERTLPSHIVHICEPMLNFNRKAGATAYIFNVIKAA